MCYNKQLTKFKGKYKMLMCSNPNVNKTDDILQYANSIIQRLCSSNIRFGAGVVSMKAVVSSELMSINAINTIASYKKQTISNDVELCMINNYVRVYDVIIKIYVGKELCYMIRVDDVYHGGNCILQSHPFTSDAKIGTLDLCLSYFNR